VVFTAFAGDVDASDVAANGIAGVVEKGDLASLFPLVERAIASCGNGRFSTLQAPSPDGAQDPGCGI